MGSAKTDTLTAPSRSRKIVISLLILAACFLFHYESLRPVYLQPLLKKPLPHTPLFFPAQGWTMYYKVANAWLTAELYGLNPGQKPQKIDLHEVLDPGFWAYDAIRQNIVMHAVPKAQMPSFCRFLAARFGQYENFMITYPKYARLTPERSPLEYVSEASLCFR